MKIIKNSIEEIKKERKMEYVLAMAEQVEAHYMYYTK
jgi:hypothetical protein